MHGLSALRAGALSRTSPPTHPTQCVHMSCLCFTVDSLRLPVLQRRRVEHLLVESNIKNRQREALPEIREILEDVETKPEDAKAR